MPKKPTNDVLKARVEAAELLGFGDDPQRLCIADRLRVDLVVSLRAAIDHASASLLDDGSNSSDLARLVNAVEYLTKLLPERQLAAPESQRDDPREVMFKIYMEMRERGEVPPEGHFRHRINELEAEIERLKTQLAGGLAPALLDVPTLGSTAIDPSEADIVPPGEIGECYLGMRPGPDDPPRPPVIEGRAVRKPPNAKPVRPPSPPQTWDDTPNGKAWQAWHDAGGNGGGDPWANNNR